MKTKTIVVATDFSAEAENATKYAAGIAAEKGYKLVLFTLSKLSVHVLNSRASANAIDQILKAKNRRINEITQSLNETFKIEVSSYLAFGDFNEELEKCISLHAPWVLVMGMAEKSLEQELLGNTTTEVINTLKVPVIAVPLFASYSGFKKILFAADALKGIYNVVLQEIKNIALEFGTKVEVFHVRDWIEQKSANDISGENETLVRNSFAGIDYTYKDVDSEEIITAIKDELLYIEADLLIMVPNRYGFWDSLVHRSKTRLMASGLEVPMLSLPL